MAKPGRNSPCACGSGKKYKHCCGRIVSSPLADSAPAATTTATPDTRTNTVELLRQALILQRRGQLAQAEASCRQVLTAEPENTTALHLLGTLALQARQYNHALELIGQAIVLNPGDAEAHMNFALALNAQQKFAQALKSIERAIALKPRFPAAYFHQANVLRRAGQTEKAVASLHRALEMNPDYVDAHISLGNCLHALGDNREALAHYQRALELQPKHIALHNNLGNLLLALGRPQEALAHYRTVLEQQPKAAEAHYNLANALAATGESEAAIKSYQQALQLGADYAQVHNNLGNVHFSQGRLQEAAACYQQALALKPDYREAVDNLTDARLKLCDWRDLNEIRSRLLHPALQQREPDSIPPRPFLITRLPLPVTAAERQQIARATVAYKTRNMRRMLAAGDVRFSHGSQANDKKRLRIAYISTDYYQHATAYLVAGLFACHERERFQVFAYSLGKDDHSAYRRRIMQDSDVFRDLRGVDNLTLARQINDDNIDILIDLNSHSGANRIEAFVSRPAPVQVNYLAFPGTSGADYMDYIITDRIVTPPEQQAYFDERFVYMPHCYQINDRARRIAGEIPSRADCGLPEKGFVFCCFNNHYKIEPRIFAVWANILQRVDGSVLWLLGGADTLVENLQREAAARDIAPERLIFGQRLPVEQHLARHKQADLFLDTYYYNAHTTGSDALWAGLPLLTCPGDSFASRVAQSLLQAVGLPELIAADLQAYEDTAVQLAQDQQRLQALKRRLAANRDSSPLFDTQRFVRNLEKAYLEMWRIYQTGEKPRPIEVVE